MQTVLQFALEHWLLVAGLVIVLILIALEQLKGRLQGVKSISVQEAVEMINHAQAVLLDVRSQHAFASSHIIDSVNIPFEDIEGKQAQLMKYKSQPIIVYCQLGQTSLKAINKLKQLGFTEVVNLAGGITAWKNARFPVVKS